MTPLHRPGWLCASLACGLGLCPLGPDGLNSAALSLALAAPYRALGVPT